jgi:serine/threonine protein kinase
MKQTEGIRWLENVPQTSMPRGPIAKVLASAIVQFQIAGAEGRAPFLITDRTVLLSNFRIAKDVAPVEGPSFRVYSAVEKATGRQCPVKFFENLIRFLRPVATLLYGGHPALDSLVGWSISLEQAPYEFAVVTRYLPEQQIQLIPDSGFALNATSRQIILYDVARALNRLYSLSVCHQDIQPANILLDENYYPHLQRIGEPSYTRTGKGSMEGCARYMAPELFSPRPTAHIHMDAYSFGILLYEFITDTPGEPVTGPGETPRQAVARGVRPAMTPETAPFADLLGCLWHSSPKQRPSMAELVTFFESRTESARLGARELSGPQGRALRDFRPRVGIGIALRPKGQRSRFQRHEVPRNSHRGSQPAASPPGRSGRRDALDILHFGQKSRQFIDFRTLSRRIFRDSQKSRT